MLGLRTARGIPAGWCREEDLRRCLSDGALVPVRRAPEGLLPDRVRIPESHWFVSDDIIAELI